MKKRTFQSGLTMIEILIVTAIIGILVIIAITTLPQQLNKARDGRRKSDLQKIKIAFENYYSDNDCYPDPDILDNCGGTELSPYLATIPCDPQTETKYLYAPEAGASCAHYYRVFSNLEVDIDPVVEELNCHTLSGCGAYTYFGEELGLDSLEYNYGVSEGVPVFVSDGISPPGASGWCCTTPGETCAHWGGGPDDGTCSQLYGETDVKACDAACKSQ